MTQPPQQPWIPPGPPSSAAGADDGAPAPARGARRPRRRRPVRRLLAVLAAVSVLLVLGVGAYGLVLARTFDDRRQTVDSAAFAAPGDGPVNLLVLGSDSRAGEDAAASDDTGRSDTMMLVHIPRDRRHVYVMSLLRDSLVDVPGHGQNKANTAYQFGGPRLTVEMMQQLTGAPVHHLMEVDFQGFRGMTEALGGVEVCNPQAFSSGQVNPSFYPRGPILLEGTAALRYVRERHAFPESDVVRVQNQQRFISAAMGRFLSPAIILNPSRSVDVVSALAGHVTVDEGLDSRALAGLAWQLRGVRRDDVTMFTMPKGRYGSTDTVGDVVFLDEEKMAALRQALADDDVESYLRRYDPEALAASDTTTADRSASATPGADVAPVLTALATGGSTAPGSGTSSAPGGDGSAADGSAPAGGALGDGVCGG